MCKVDIQVRASALDQPRVWFATIADEFQVLPFSRKTHIWVMGANIDSIQIRPMLTEQGLQFVVNFGDLPFIALAASDNRLVGYNDSQKAGLIYLTDGLGS